MKELLSRKLISAVLSLFLILLGASLSCENGTDATTDNTNNESSPATATPHVIETEEVSPAIVTEVVETVPTKESTQVAETQTPRPQPPPTLMPTVESAHHIKVVPNSVKVRSGPGVNDAVVGYLYAGDLYPILETSTDGSWFKIELEDGTEGWIATSVVEVMETTAASDISDNGETSYFEGDPAEVFIGKEPFIGVGTEIMSDPDDVMAPFIPVDIGEVVSNGILYRYYYAEGVIPEDLYDPICPGNLTTVWYTFEAAGSGEISINFTVEVMTDGVAYPEWFSPFFGDEFADAVGNPTFEPPVYLVMCTDPENKHSHYSGIISETSDIGRNVRCSIIENQAGTLIEADTLQEFTDFSGPISVSCMFPE